jgi:hypothetical protein
MDGLRNMDEPERLWSFHEESMYKTSNSGAQRRLNRTTARMEAVGAPAKLTPKQEAARKKALKQQRCERNKLKRTRKAYFLALSEIKAHSGTPKRVW